MIKYLVIITTLIAVICAPWGFSYHEDGWMRYFGARILEGEVPYRDFFLPTPPLTYYLSALLVALQGFSLLGEWVVVALMRMVLIAIVYKISLELTEDKIRAFRAAFLALLIQCFLAFPWWYLWYDDLAITLFALTVWWLWKDYPIAAGVSLALTLLTKQTYGILLIPLYFFSPTRKIPTLASCAFIITSFIAYLYLQDALFPFLQHVFVDSWQLKSSNGTLFDRYLSLNVYHHRLPFTLGHLFGLSLFVSLCFNNTRKILISLATIALILLIRRAVIENPDPLQWGRELFLETLTVAIPWYLLIVFWRREFKEKYFFLAGVLALMAQRASGWTNGVVLLIPVIEYAFPLLGRWKSVLTIGVLGAAYFVTHPLGEKQSWFHMNQRVLGYKRVSGTTARFLDRVKRYMKEGEEVLFYPAAPLLYSFTGTKPVDPFYPIAYPDFMTGERRRHFFVERTPKVIVYENFESDPYREKEWKQMIEERYDRIDQIENGYGKQVSIFRLRV